ncbi:uncharacterized protein QYS62_003048 [Fusarium acuminatum]|uniref:Uncharacterized protein n=1 Tax=Fusarium acuminatum TaxID=5515 RepID=A0ABZ2WNU5_9HYPO
MSSQVAAPQITISPKNTGLWGVSQNEEAAKLTGHLLEKDLTMLHHILALYGTGANAKQLQWAFDLRHELQRPAESRSDDVIAKLSQDWSNAREYLGKEEHYPNFLAYFQKMISIHGYEQVVKNFLMRGDATADDLLVRLHAGVLHPLIQLMYGLEWKEPAIVAEALALTCVHQVESLDQLLLASEYSVAPSAPQMPALLDMFYRARNLSSLDGATQFQDENKIEDGILQRAKEPMLSILRDVRVQDNELEERTSEMFHTIILVASSAAIHPPHHVKYDFFLMHHVNSALLYLTTLDAPWLSRREKCRLLEWKIRMDLIQSWAILNDDATWIKIQHMVVDALEVPGPLYVRSAGFQEAWQDAPPHGTPPQSPEQLHKLQTGSGSSAEALASA